MDRFHGFQNVKMISRHEVHETMNTRDLLKNFWFSHLTGECLADRPLLTLRLTSTRASRTTQALDPRRFRSSGKTKRKSFTTASQNPSSTSSSRNWVKPVFTPSDSVVSSLSCPRYLELKYNFCNVLFVCTRKTWFGMWRPKLAPFSLALWRL